MTTIDLNADLGEGEGTDAALLDIVSSCNIACGGHTGDAESMTATITAAMRADVAIGVHPSYPDRDGFGRRSAYMDGDELYAALSQQVEEFCDIAADLGAQVAHLKPHGALYNDAARDAGLAAIVARVADEAPAAIWLLGPPNSALQQVAGDYGIGFVPEAFVDRAYGADGDLVPRAEAGAVFNDTKAMTEQALSIAQRRMVRATNGVALAIHASTLCVHGDTPGAVAAAKAVRSALERAGITIQAVTRNARQ
jgi:UPF0271 protein